MLEESDQISLQVRDDFGCLGFLPLHRRFYVAIFPRRYEGKMSNGFSENSIINFVTAALTAMTAACNAEADGFALSPFFFGDVISSGTL